MAKKTPKTTDSAGPELSASAPFVDDAPDGIYREDDAVDASPAQVFPQATADDSLLARRAAYEAEIGAIEQQEFELAARKRRLTQELDGVIRQLARVVHPHENQLAIQQAIEQSQQERAQRAARVRQLIEMGADPTEIATTPRSPLDIAIALKNKRGGYRYGQVVSNG